MGYILLFVFILTWLNVRKIRKALLFLAKQEGYCSSLKGKIFDVISDYAAERKSDKDARKKQHKLKVPGTDAAPVSESDV